MGTRCRIHQDERGPFIKHGSRKIRPLANTSNQHLAGPLAEPYRQEVARNMRVSRICADGQSEYRPDEIVEKYHIGGSTMVRVWGYGERGSEVWFIHDEEVSDDAPGPR